MLYICKVWEVQVVWDIRLLTWLSPTTTSTTKPISWPCRFAADKNSLYPNLYASRSWSYENDTLQNSMIQLKGKAPLLFVLILLNILSHFLVNVSGQIQGVSCNCYTRVSLPLSLSLKTVSSHWNCNSFQGDPSVSRTGQPPSWSIRSVKGDNPTSSSLLCQGKYESILMISILPKSLKKAVTT